MSPITWVRERVHRTCTDLITAQHDAVVDSAQAHHRAERELTETRAENERLQTNLAAAKERLDQVKRLLTADHMSLTHPRLPNEDPVGGAMTNLVLIRMLLRSEANLPEHRGTYYANHLHDLADTIHRRICEAHQATHDGHTPSHQILDILQAPLGAALPTPRQAAAAEQAQVGQ